MVGTMALSKNLFSVSIRPGSGDIKSSPTPKVACVAVVVEDPQAKTTEH